MSFLLMSRNIIARISEQDLKPMATTPIISGRPGSIPVDPVERASSPGSWTAPKDGFADLVPELSVSNIQDSLLFWCGLLGFEIAYDRPAARFAFLVREGLQIMLCERNGRWEQDEMERPFGRGINLQMAVAHHAPLLAALAEAAWPLYEPPSDAWYRVGDYEHGQREFLVQDPDGYLLRFIEELGIRSPR
jgi:catechol 2,3-dioxygenase-like lactoylglutathione lyase family enzyme